MAFHFFFSNRERFSETRKLFEPVIADFYFWATSRVFPAPRGRDAAAGENCRALQSVGIGRGREFFRGTFSKNTFSKPKLLLLCD